MQKQVIFALFTVLLLTASPIMAKDAPQIGYTMLGEEVILSPDKTWKYGHNKSKSGKEIYHSKNTASTLEYDADLWTPLRKKINSAASLNLRHRQENAYSLCFFEAIRIDQDQIRNFFLNSLLKTDPKAKLLESTEIKVNGKNIYASTINATVNNLKVTYYAASYTGPEGSYQVISFTDQEQFQRLKPSFNELLTGLQIR